MADAILNDVLPTVTVCNFKAPAKLLGHLIASSSCNINNGVQPDAVTMLEPDPYWLHNRRHHRARSIVPHFTR